MDIPGEALGAAIGVLLYSILSLTLCLSLVGLLISYGERWTYVTLHSCFAALSTFASIIQQIHYASDWRQVQQAKFEKAVLAVADPGLTFVGEAHKFDVVLFFIQFWCYNIMALNILFWSIALFVGSWGFRTPWLGDWRNRIGPMSKIFSVVFPSIIVSLMQVRAVLRRSVLTFIVTNATMFISLTTGSLLLVLTLYKYMKTRRLAAGGSRRGRWWASSESKSRQSHEVGSHYTRGTAQLSKRSSIYDRALIIRFSVGFVINALFLVAIIIFSYVTSTNNAAVVAAGQADFRPQAAIIDIVLFIPGVTASLVTFLVFGTAKSWRQYRDLYAGGCGVRNRLIQRRFIRQQEGSDIGATDRDGDQSGAVEFAPLPRIETTRSEEERRRQDEAKKRVQMFSREVSSERSVVTTTITAGDDFRSVTPVWDATSVGDSTLVGVNVSNDNEYAGLPLAPRPVQQQQPHQTHQTGEKSGGRSNMQFHRPRTSNGHANRAGFGNGSTDTSGTIEVGLEKENNPVVKPGVDESQYGGTAVPVNRPGWSRADSTYR